MQKQPTFSIFVVNIQALIMLCVVGYVSPFTNKSANSMELMNEFFVLLTNYHLYMFTDFLQDTTTREFVGKSLVFLTCVNVGLNFGLILAQNLSNVGRKMKLAF
jgi:hypothetical protein